MKSLENIISLLEADLRNELDPQCASTQINGLATLEGAKKGDITFYHNPAYYKQALVCQASAIISHTPIEFEDGENAPLVLLVHNPYVAWAKVVQLFYPITHSQTGISSDATVHETVKMGEGVVIYPKVHIDKNVTLGDGVVIYPGCHVGESSVIGDRTILYANVSVYHQVSIGQDTIIHSGSVIGADGFGFAPDRDKNWKIPQIGTVKIGNHVEVGANVCIDRAALEETIIEDYVKLDNQIQIAHGVKIGHSSMIAAQFGAAGGAQIGKRFLCGGQASVSGHVNVPESVTCGGRTAITRTPQKGETVMGYPAIKANDWRRLQVYLKKLPEAFASLKELKKKLK